MSFAKNYHRWILEIFLPFMGKRIVEVGAGSGSFSELLLSHNPKSLSLVEPSEMYQLLNEHVKGFAAKTPIKTYHTIFTSVAQTIKREQRPDSIVYINVLEHIEDDAAELRAMYQTLDPGGRIFIFVPALQWLYGSFDRQVGHFRRYKKKELEDKCRDAGFRILQVKYFDLFGIAPWWVKYCLLKSPHMEPEAVKLYDKYVVPLAKAFETAIEPMSGKNLILIAEKSTAL